MSASAQLTTTVDRVFVKRTRPVYIYGFTREYEVCII